MSDLPKYIAARVDGDNYVLELNEGKQFYSDIAHTPRIVDALAVVEGQYLLDEEMKDKRAKKKGLSQ